MFKDATTDDIDMLMHSAWQAFLLYRKIPLKKRAGFLRHISLEIEQLGDDLLKTAQFETNLPEPRLRSERARTIFQLNSYADFCERGQWLDVRIDEADPNRNPPQPDLRKTLVPLGPVLVFGASNFPFAYSTAGGDTACAFAAGCPVIVKAHPSHPATSELVAGAIRNAVEKSGMPKGVFAHVYGASNATGEALVKHPYTKAVGFTGSFAGGKQLFDWGNQRKEPIPVFAEMGSVNPVFLLPGKMKEAAAEAAKMYAASITLSSGQFCTNPGVIIGVDNADLDNFIKVLSSEVEKISPAPMLNRNIHKNYTVKKETALQQKGVDIIAGSIACLTSNEQQLTGNPAIATTTASNFIDNPLLQEEVFGPYSIMVRCKDIVEMESVAKIIHGQLTATLMATDQDVFNNQPLVELVKDLCGRLILNGVPTGVEVCLAMQHGGPFPATTDSRFTSVGADDIKRFARPVSYQNWPDHLLPDELKNANPLKICRTVNNQLQL